MIMHGQLPSELDDIVEDFHNTFAADQRGTLLSDIRAFSRPLSLIPPRGDAPVIHLATDVMQMLTEWGGVRGCRIESTNSATSHRKLVLRGVTFEPQEVGFESGKQLPQSLIAMGKGIVEGWRSARIESIFTHSDETFCVVKPFRELDASDLQWDFYRRFPIAGGRICYQAMDSRIVVHWRDIICHIAFAAAVSDEINNSHFLALPLDRVSHFWRRLFRNLTCTLHRIEYLRASSRITIAHYRCTKGLNRFVNTDKLRLSLACVRPKPTSSYLCGRKYILIMRWNFVIDYKPG